MYILTYRYVRYCYNEMIYIDTLIYDILVYYSYTAVLEWKASNPVVLCHVHRQVLV